MGAIIAARLPWKPGFANFAGAGRTLLLKDDASRGTGSDLDSRHREVPEHQGGLLCSLCQSPVTSRAWAISMSGSHARSFVNPHAIEFRIGCFADAPGCVGRGEESSYWTWFPGFTWQIALCRRCGEHLGWLFRSSDASFFGLILDRLAEGD